ncbi:hypothetical protein DFH29DRAFT_816899, partial [Suillus ampliporus]
SVKWTRNQLFLRSRMLQKTRGVNSWNTFVKARLNDENEGQLRQRRLHKTYGLHRRNKATLLRDYRKLTFAEKQAYNARVLEDHQAKNHTARSNPKAVKHDVNAAFTFMDREVCHSILRPLWHLSSIRWPSHEHVTLNRQRPLNKLISECRELIQDNLEFILMEKNVSGKVKMNHTNYERAIVEHHGVELTKWPLPGGVKNPSKAGGRV